MLQFCKLKLIICSNAEYDCLFLHTNLEKKNQFLCRSSKYTSPTEIFTFLGEETFKTSIKYFSLKNKCLKVFLFCFFCEKKWWVWSLRYLGLCYLIKTQEFLEVACTHHSLQEMQSDHMGCELWNKREDKGISMKIGAWKSSEMWKEGRPFGVGL